MVAGHAVALTPMAVSRRVVPRIARPLGANSSASVKKSVQVPRRIASCTRMLTRRVRCGRVRPGAAWCGQVRLGAAGCGQVRPGAARCGRVRPGAARCTRCSAVRRRRLTRRVECLRGHLYEALDHAAEKCARRSRGGVGDGGPQRAGHAVAARRAHFSERRIHRAAQTLRATSQVRPGAARCGQVRLGAAGCGEA
jgi:hypothetical protein